MREIKFRALYDDMSGGWRYGMLIYEGSVPRIQEKGTMLFSTCLKGTEGQYTGLKDKNGNEVYEGDIFQCRSGDDKADMQGEVYFDEGSFKITYGYQKPKNKDRKDYFLSSTISTDTAKIIEVIGNIYENPELIK